jgi:pimeloyl-ACP methyl ester carboxylesterase
MPRPPSRRGAVLGAIVLVLAAACSSGAGVQTEEASQIGPPPTRDASTSPTTDATPPPTDGADDPEDPDDEASSAPPTDDGGATGAIDWQPIDDLLDTGTLDVPVDYDDPSAGSFRLFLVRHRAADEDARIGTLLVNPGGPGFGGTSLAAQAELIYDEELLDRFDIVGWDPRGTGYTTPAIDCIDDYDEYFAGTDITPDDEDERQEIVDLAEDFEEQCVTKNAEILQHIGTNDSARDIDSIRRALGEDEISYFGFSYGSELGATWATLFPDTVRAAVLDGAADPTVGLTEGGLQQSKGFEDALTAYLADCSADEDCAFHNDGDAEGAFDELMLALDEEPVPSEPGRPDVTRGVALQAVSAALYEDSTWNQLSEGLAAAQDGDGEGLLGLWDGYFQRQPDGTWPNLLEAFQTIRCMDETERLTVEEDDALAPEYQRVAPRMSPGTTGSYFCTFYPPTEDPRVEITGAGAGPIVVVGTTGDPATPLASTRVMADTLEDGRLVVVTADQHTGYSVNDCGDDVIHRYLVDLEIPPATTDC